MTHVQKETAILLKEKGFDLPSRQFFSEERDRVSNTQENNPINWNKYQGEYSAPTLYEAAEWLREKGVHVHVRVHLFRWGYYIQIIGDFLVSSVSGFMFDTHDQALEAGIVHALKHYVK